MADTFFGFDASINVSTRAPQTVPLPFSELRMPRRDPPQIRFFPVLYPELAPLVESDPPGGPPRLRRSNTYHLCASRHSKNISKI
jgi:hypothetical protein